MEIRKMSKRRTLIKIRKVLVYVYFFARPDEQVLSL